MVGGPKEKKKKKYINKMLSAPWGNVTGKKVSVLLSALVENFGVSRMRDFFFIKISGKSGSNMNQKKNKCVNEIETTQNRQTLQLIG